jgi:hypothetical protein
MEGGIDGWMVRSIDRHINKQVDWQIGRLIDF